MSVILHWREWRWLAEQPNFYGPRGMADMRTAMETYFAPASKLRKRATIARRQYRLRAKADGSVRVYSAIGTWAAKRAPALT